MRIRLQFQLGHVFSDMEIIYGTESDNWTIVSIGPRPFIHGNMVEVCKEGINNKAFQLGHVLSDMEMIYQA